MKWQTAIYWILMVVFTAVLVLTDFVRMGFDTNMFSDVSYWLNVASVQIPIVLMTFVARSHAKAKEIQDNTELQERRDTIRRGYGKINKNALVVVFSDYVRLDDRRRKLEAYTSRIKARIAAVTAKLTRLENVTKRRQIKLTRKARERGEEIAERNPLFMVLSYIREARSEHLGDKLDALNAQLASAEEDIEFIRVRYIPITPSIIFGDAERAHVEETDLRAHESGQVITMLVTKVILIVLFGMLATSTVVFNIEGDVVGILFKTAIKLGQVCFSIYCGTQTGRQYVRGELMNSYRKRETYIQKFFTEKGISDEKTSA